MTAPSLTALVDAVVNVHHVRARASIARLDPLIERLANEEPEVTRAARALFSVLERHMRTEEGSLFPAIRLLDKPGCAEPLRADLHLSIRVMQHDHGALVQRLEELRRTLASHAKGGGDVRELRDGLEAFDRDLERHIEIEDDFLMPLTLASPGA